MGVVTPTLFRPLAEARPAGTVRSGEQVAREGGRERDTGQCGARSGPAVDRAGGGHQLPFGSPRVRNDAVGTGFSERVPAAVWGAGPHESDRICKLGLGWWSFNWHNLQLVLLETGTFMCVYIPVFRDNKSCLLAN